MLWIVFYYRIAMWILLRISRITVSFFKQLQLQKETVNIFSFVMKYFATVSEKKIAFPPFLGGQFFGLYHGTSSSRYFLSAEH